MVEVCSSVSSNLLLESGLIIFNLIEGNLAHSNVFVEVVMDDMAFASYVSSKARSRQTQFSESKSQATESLIFVC